ncbi:hypothetical protein SISSUDRAFT_1067301 [Sistotremastrum suecicum HHB10207 ss-3]|uniref:Uncharacterized protein n=1 Tax=Sistotremastrum suecicum HHB10207 ss-3 TaxID=1314776 RepID=A0A165X9R5_9AGAM|nr:hypothetical protein SISSUDRAFT_1067301 [Sistotremastrum suecicum HHB10207 ss-3]
MAAIFSQMIGSDSGPSTTITMRLHDWDGLEKKISYEICSDEEPIDVTHIQLEYGGTRPPKGHEDRLLKLEIPMLPTYNQGQAIVKCIPTDEPIRPFSVSKTEYYIQLDHPLQQYKIAIPGYHFRMSAPDGWREKVGTHSIEFQALVIGNSFTVTAWASGVKGAWPGL